MPTASRNSEGDGASAIPVKSHIVKIQASSKIHNLCGAPLGAPAHIVKMEDSPNNLKAWRLYRKLSQAELASRCDTTGHMIHYLETGQRGLSLKWLLRLAPALGTTPGFLLDHDPNELPSDILEIWGNADERERRQIVEIARTLVSTGTDG